jgi:hypothetical protein
MATVEPVAEKAPAWPYPDRGAVMIGLVIVELVFAAGAVALFAFGFLLAAAFLLMIAWGANAIIW